MIKIEKFVFRYKQNKEAINPEKMIASSFLLKELVVLRSCTKTFKSYFICDVT